MQNDLERIEDLHQTDMRASKEGDYGDPSIAMSDYAAVLPGTMRSSGGTSMEGASQGQWRPELGALPSHAHPAAPT
jgi:hypothetical protein